MYLSIHPPSIHLSVYPLFIQSPIHQYILYIHSPTHTLIHHSNYSSICPSTHPSICPSVHPHPIQTHTPVVPFLSHTSFHIVYFSFLFLPTSLPLFHPGIWQVTAIFVHVLSITLGYLSISVYSSITKTKIQRNRNHFQTSYSLFCLLRYKEWPL